MTTRTEPTSPGRRAVVLLPTLNEAEGLARTVAELPLDHLRASGFDPRVLVVDGGSTDGSPDVAAARGAVVLPQRGRGKGGAIREGLDWAKSQSAEFVVVLDADFTYPGSAVPAILSLLESGSDLVVGVRRPAHAPFNDLRSLIHRLGNGALNFTAAQISRRPILDLCSGLWGLRLTAVQELELRSDGFDIEAELFLKSFRAGFNIAQIPVVYRERVGTAKLHALRDGSRILLAILRYGRHPAPATHAPLDVTPDAARARSLHQVAAIVLTSEARLVGLSSPPGRMGEAGELERLLFRAAPELEVVRHERPNGAPELWRDPQQLLPEVSSLERQPSVTVTIPEAQEVSPSVPNALVTIPRSDRVVWVGSPPPTLHISGGRRSPPLPFQPETRTTHALGSLILLTSALDPSPAARELALLWANGGQGEVQVFHRPGRRRAQIASPALPPLAAPGGDRAL